MMADMDWQLPVLAAAVTYVLWHARRRAFPLGIIRELRDARMIRRANKAIEAAHRVTEKRQ